MTAHRFTPSDEGKPVVTPDGDIVGTVGRVEPEGVFVRPRTDLLRGCGSWVAGPWERAEEFRLDCGTVVRVTGREVVIHPASIRATGTVPEPNRL
jgi:hypothetical protein